MARLYTDREEGERMKGNEEGETKKKREDGSHRPVQHLIVEDQPHDTQGASADAWNIPRRAVRQQGGGYHGDHAVARVYPKSKRRLKGPEPVRSLDLRV